MTLKTTPSTDTQPAADYAILPGGDCRQHPIKVGVWNYYEELTTNGFIFQNANASIGHDLLKPWCDLHHYGQVHGIDFVTLDQTDGPQDLDAILFMDRPRGSNPLVEQLMAAPIAKFLCIFETEVIKPDNWDTDYHRLFDRVFTWSDAHVDDKRYIKQNFAIDPVCPYDLEALKSAFATRKLCTLVAGAKSSPHPNELYSERVRTIRWFEAHAPHDFDLYGMGWNASSFPSYRGAVQDKLATLAGYRFTICYENARNYPGYITEKILDCLRAGTVPVYLGAPNISRWIPDDCFIDRNAFASEADLYAYLLAMDADTHAQFTDRISAFLGSAGAYPFSIECFVHTVSSFIAKDVQTRKRQCPDVTVAIPAYNYASYLGEAIQSALTQDVENLEVLVLDNASTDPTQSLVAQLGPSPKLRYMRNSRNLGAPLNWRNALQVASGRYIAILSADDSFLPAHLGRMVALMDANPHLSLSYCPCIWMDEAGEPLYVIHPHGHPAEDTLGGRNEVAHLLAHDCFVTPSAALIRRSALEQVGNLDLSLHGAVDWDLWIRLAEEFPDFAFFKEPRVRYRKHGEQDTARLLKSASLLIDHIAILEKTLARGSLPLLAPMAQPIELLLRAKFMAYPHDMVAPLQARMEAVIQTLRAPAPAPATPTASLEQAAFVAALQGQLELVDLINATERLAAAQRQDLEALLYRLWLAQSSSALKYVAAFNLATVLERTGEVAEAQRFYAQAVQLNPAFTPAAQRLAELSKGNT